MLGLLARCMKFTWMALAAASVLPVAAHAESCSAERLSASQEWDQKGGEGGQAGFAREVEELSGMLRSSPDWNDPGELRKDAVTPARISPALDALMMCFAKERLAQLEASGGKTADHGAALPEGGIQASTPQARQEVDPDPGCELTLGDSTTGPLTTETATLISKCSVRVGYTYCVTSQNGGGAFSCDERKFGSGIIGPGAIGYVSIVGVSGPFQVHFGYCKATPSNQTPLAVNQRWNGKHVDVDCR